MQSFELFIHLEQEKINFMKIAIRFAQFIVVHVMFK